MPRTPARSRQSVPTEQPDTATAVNAPAWAAVLPTGDSADRPLWRRLETHAGRRPTGVRNAIYSALRRQQPAIPGRCSRRGHLCAAAPVRQRRAQPLPGVAAPSPTATAALPESAGHRRSCVSDRRRAREHAQPRTCTPQATRDRACVARPEGAGIPTRRCPWPGARSVRRPPRAVAGGRCGSGRSTWGYQAAMPAQNRARSDETVVLDRIRQPSDQRSQDRPVRPIQSRPAVGPPQHGDLLAQHEQFGVFGSGRPGKQHEPAGKAGEDQIQPSSRSDTAHDHPAVTGWPSAQVTGPRRLLTPTGQRADVRDVR
jgi:hypothetical protein